MAKAIEGLDEKKKEEKRKMLAGVPSHEISLLLISYPTYQNLGNNMIQLIRSPEFANIAHGDGALIAAKNGEKLDLNNLTKNFRQLIKQGLA